VKIVIIVAGIFGSLLANILPKKIMQLSL